MESGFLPPLRLLQGNLGGALGLSSFAGSVVHPQGSLPPASHPGPRAGRLSVAIGCWEDCGRSEGGRSGWAWVPCLASLG